MSQRGFTLLEMMLVIVLMGLAAVLVLPAFPSTPQKTLQQQQARFRAQLEFARDSSQQAGLLLGVRIKPDGWAFSLLQRQSTASHAPETVHDLWQGYRWQHWQPRRAALGGQLPAAIRLELQPADGPRRMTGDDPTAEPDVLLLPDGSVTPFTLLFRQTESDTVSGLRVDARGAITPFESEARP